MEYEDVCPICLDDLDDNVTNICLPCNHKMCNECFQMIVDHRQILCPLCRHAFRDYIVYDMEDIENTENDIEENNDKEWCNPSVEDRDCIAAYVLGCVIIIWIYVIYMLV